MDNILYPLTVYPCNKNSHPGLIKPFIICLALYVLIPANAQAIVEGGPNDYYDTSSWTHEYLRSVNSNHLVPAQNQVTNGYTGGKHYNIWGEIDFILRWFPNHPQGLQFMARWLPEYPHPPDKNVEYYFRKAIEYKPSPKPRPVDATAPMLYAIYLHKKKNYAKAQEQYESALSITPNNSEIHYNLGLLLIERNDYPAALKHAHIAYSMGFPLPGLKNKLKKLGAWKDIPEEQKSAHLQQEDQQKQ